ncbi:TPA: ANR family transcriptional regulator [Providencia alcalifaciens]
MKLTYLNIANQAAEAEREGDYSKAAQLWGQAKNLTKSDAVRQWAEYRVEHNTLRYSLSAREMELAERARKAREKYKLKKEAELLEVNINKASEVVCE